MVRCDVKSNDDIKLQSELDYVTSSCALRFFVVSQWTFSVNQKKGENGNLNSIGDYDVNKAAARDSLLLPSLFGAITLIVSEVKAKAVSEERW